MSNNTEYRVTGDGLAYRTGGYDVTLHESEDKLFIQYTKRNPDSVKQMTIYSDKIFNEGFLNAYVKDAVDFISSIENVFPFREQYEAKVKEILGGFFERPKSAV